ncbi:MAG: hypothetical protein JWM92_627 [Candidatus Nomurabacteria bacterium]|jgi:hypothetical protein|nr:hypothetical protein [Candidatus Nomurabacteria bacterium]
MRYFFFLTVIAASVGIFIVFILPRYSAIQTARAAIVSYNTNLVTANQLQQSRQALIAQYNGISKDDLNNIQTLLPDSVDNIRLIIQINALATKNGLASLRQVDYSADQAAIPAASTLPASTSTPSATLQPYAPFTISFETSGQYSNFLSFISDLEQNLRLVDITSIDFTSAADSSTTGTAGPAIQPGSQSVASGLKYKVTLKTYWLKK